MTTFAEQHREMLDIADEILAAVQSDDEAALRTVSKLRLQLSKEVSTHVEKEVSLIRRNPGGHQAGGSDRDRLLSRYHDELLVWRGQLSACNTDWSPARVRTDPKGFVAIFRPLRDALEKRVRWEEEVFYPAVLSQAHLGHRAA